MARNGSHMPQPEAIWIALALVVWAVAIALGDQRGRRFIDALDALVADHDAQRRVVALTPQNGGKRQARRHLAVALAFIARIVATQRGAQ